MTTNHHRRFAIRLVAITVLAITALGCFAYAASARTRPDTMPMIGTVQIHYGADLVTECGDEDALGCAAPWDGDIWVGRRPTPMTVQHELGHVFIWRAMYDTGTDGSPVVKPSMQWAEDQIKATLGYPLSRRFWSAGASPAERAAEAYAVCATGNGPHYGRVRLHGRMVRTLYVRGGAYDYTPGLRMHLSMCSLFHKIAKVV